MFSVYQSIKSLILMSSSHCIKKKTINLQLYIYLYACIYTKSDIEKKKKYSLAHRETNRIGQHWPEYNFYVKTSTVLAAFSSIFTPIETTICSSHVITPSLSSLLNRPNNNTEALSRPWRSQMEVSKSCYLKLVS